MASPGVVGIVGVLGVSGVTMPVPIPINEPGAAADAGADGLAGRDGAGCAKTPPPAEPVPPPISALWTEGLLSHAELEALSDEESRELMALVPE